MSLYQGGSAPEMWGFIWNGLSPYDYILLTETQVILSNPTYSTNHEEQLILFLNTSQNQFLLSIKHHCSRTVCISPLLLQHPSQAPVHGASVCGTSAWTSASVCGKCWVIFMMAPPLSSRQLVQNPSMLIPLSLLSLFLLNCHSRT